MEGNWEVSRNKEAKTLMKEMVCRYMGEFKLARVVKYWIALHCHKKTLEYRLILSWIKKDRC